MARIKLAYVGGGSTRAPGTMASFIQQGQNFQGSEIVLIDIDGSHLPLVKTLADKMARNCDIDLKVSYTTDRRAGLQDCDAVLTSYRPGGFEARYYDEAIPLRHGVIGQETQGPGGFFMALRTIHVMQGIIADIPVHVAMVSAGHLLTTLRKLVI
jgi:6-phospho-beta-glucosidase